MRLLERRLVARRRSNSSSATLETVKTVASGPELELGRDDVDDQAEVRRSEGRQPNSAGKAKKSPTVKVLASPNGKLKRQLSAINSLAAIKLKMLIFGALTSAFVVLLQLLTNLQQVEAGFFTFYFPNVFKPKGFGELTDMIHSLEGQINETKDAFHDAQYFWGQLERLDTIESDYPEESACSEVFPLFRGHAIEYIYVDYEYYIKPIELYREHLIEFRDKWYPAGSESKAALPREWEQKLMERELELKIDWLGKLVSDERHREMRNRMIEIWKNVRRSLDTSLPCIYLRYAYRQIAEDINQVALEGNLEGMQEAMKVLVNAYKRIDKFKESDKKIVKEIEDELEKVERFTIRT